MAIHAEPATRALLDLSGCTFPKIDIICDPERAALVQCTELTGSEMMAPEAVVVGLELISCEVTIEMPVGSLSIAGPIVRPEIVIATSVLSLMEPVVMVKMMLVEVNASQEAAKPLAMVIVGVGVEAKKLSG